MLFYLIVCVDFIWWVVIWFAVFIAVRLVVCYWLALAVLVYCASCGFGIVCVWVLVSGLRLRVCYGFASGFGLVGCLVFCGSGF